MGEGLTAQEQRSVLEGDDLVHILDRGLDGVPRVLQQSLLVPRTDLFDVEISVDFDPENWRILDQSRQNIGTLLWRQRLRWTVVAEQMNTRAPGTRFIGDDRLNGSRCRNFKAWVG